MGSPEPAGDQSFIGIDCHGDAVSHLNPICHIGYRGEEYRGGDLLDWSTWSAVTTMSAGEIARGVLVDIPAARRVNCFELGTCLHTEDVAPWRGRIGMGV